MPARDRSSTLKPHWFHILLALSDRNLHGLQIMREVLERTDGQVHLWPGMLYGSLRQMVSQGHIAERLPGRHDEAGGGTPRYYGITKKGKRALIRDVKLIARYVKDARAKRLIDDAELA